MAFDPETKEPIAASDKTATAREGMLERRLASDESSERLQAALDAGTYPDDRYLEPLIRRCAMEPDFYVRDMLTWALTRLSLEVVLPRVMLEAASSIPQARGQALHTLSKLRDPRGWAAISTEYLHDPDPEVARTAWRTAVGLAPDDEWPALAAELVHELGRGELETLRSLSRALVELGEAAKPLLEAATLIDDDRIALHARATLKLMEDPEATFVME